jgi:uncharacterized protein with beta-barrel porin domain
VVFFIQENRYFVCSRTQYQTGFRAECAGLSELNSVCKKLLVRGFARAEFDCYRIFRRLRIDNAGFDAQSFQSVRELAYLFGFAWGKINPIIAFFLRHYKNPFSNYKSLPNVPDK